MSYLLNAVARGRGDSTELSNLSKETLADEGKPRIGLLHRVL
jgi:hypothetical protein